MSQSGGPGNVKKLGPQPKPQRLPTPPPTLKSAGKTGVAGKPLTAPAKAGAAPVRPSTPAPNLKPGQQPFKAGMVRNPMGGRKPPTMGNKG